MISKQISDECLSVMDTRDTIITRESDFGNMCMTSEGPNTIKKKQKNKVTHTDVATETTKKMFFQTPTFK